MEEEQHHARSSSTPRKRIISDGHWKAGEHPKEQKSSNSAPRPRPESARYDLSYTSTQETPRERRRSRRQFSYEKRSEAQQISPYNDGMRIGPGPFDQSGPDDEDTSQVDEQLARRLTTAATFSDELDRYSDTSIQPEEPNEGIRPQSKYVATLGRGVVPSTTDVLQSKKGGLLGKTRDMFLKSETLTPINNRIPSIEAWLEEQPDPFVDGARSDDLPPAAIPAPLRSRARRKKSSVERSYVPDPNQIWESIDPRVEVQFSEAIESREQEDSTTMSSPWGDQKATPSSRGRERRGEEVRDCSPSTLRRAGARVRRHKDSPSKGSISSFEIPRDAERLPEKAVATEPVKSSTSRPQQSPSAIGAHQLPPIPLEEIAKDDNIAARPLGVSSRADTGLKRRLTTHEDLMSVLSMPGARKSRRSVRRARSRRMAEDSASAQEVLAGLVADEKKYSQELRTLVDGVIPVLLQSVLSKTDSAAAAGLFTSSTSAQDDMSFTKPIIEMGISLERLKSLHGRIPLHSLDSFLAWAQTAQKAYREYLQAWRLGFQDVVVNLAPLDNATSAEQDMARDASGDLVDGEGKKVDVAYLLKRPLVRVKTLSKTFGQIQDRTDKPLAAQMTDAFADLTAFARRRHQEEQARLEDEAAANIDAMRSRDIRTMAPVAGVVVDNTRRVKARDFFNLTLYHSSGQRMDCGIELIFRDNARGDAPGGDLLICEVDDTGKWLLFAPVLLTSVSARRGEDDFDLVVMVRGRAGLGKEWQELLALKTDDKEAVNEWMGMLGSNALPPRLNRTPSFVKRAQRSRTSSTKPNETEISKDSEPESRSINHELEQANVDIPIGAPSVLAARKEVSHHSEDANIKLHKPPPRLNLGGGLASRPQTTQFQTQSMGGRRPIPSVLSSDRSTISDQSIKTITTSSTSRYPLPRADSLPARTDVATAPKSSPGPLVPERSTAGILPVLSRNDDKQKGTAAERDSRDPKSSPLFKLCPSSKDDQRTTSSRSDKPPLSQLTGSSNSQTSVAQETRPQRPVFHRAPSSTPSKELPTVARVRPQSQSQSTNMGLANSGLKDRHGRKDTSPEQKSSPKSGHHKSSSRSQIFTEDVPAPPAIVSRQARPAMADKSPEPSPPPTPAHRTSKDAQSQAKSNHIPELKATPIASEKTRRRRTSSPLKHEYAPSISSDSSSNYDTDNLSDSDTSEDFSTERQDKATPLVAIASAERRPSKQSYPPSSMQSTGTRTLAPSDSASQGPYRRVPSSNTVPSDQKKRAAAVICSWSDSGVWEMIHPDECSIVITPGLIEAYEMSAEHSNPDAVYQEGENSRTSSMSRQPLVAFELTPRVMLRKGTALDIQIRSPPTPNSRIRTNSHVMFRSCNLQACDLLYGMINWARCNNPTYIELERARPRQTTVTFNVNPTDQPRSRASSWFSFGSAKKSSYRASSAPTPASIDMSVESSGTMANAFSALRRFSAKPAFNLNRSSVLRRNGSSGTGQSLYSSSSGTGTGIGSGSSTPAPSQLGFIPGKDGPNVPATSADAAGGGGMVNNMKIRMYIRKGQHWEHLGAARLSVLPAPVGPTSTQASRAAGAASVGPSPPATPTHTRSLSNVEPTSERGPRLPSSSHTPHRVHGNGHEKRVLIVRNKVPDVILLDAVLGESCFERIMQTGIAVKVWKEDEVIGHTGGVTMGRETVYMLQFPGTKEAGWVFGLCGTYRYGYGNE
ncbi:hypothetical protein LTR47_002141 [Exophiala xenobiotica]|nr:hypothetical protein LTR41_006021 [Exophiala xenobiotica]KAK5222871.1 hypothetical protein LTR72_005708 [Exophiala xenobiotica]KAK5236963.1 hypothetical protein LTR47_002141 [Exophiala xenobiotica]KAK5252163.1 hypothetical protein LTS06_003254 [Exophiala xenobiotica]KAK5297309.1 hypothetical protein LTR14_003040 [Exophiala xenobiotica]